MRFGSLRLMAPDEHVGGGPTTTIEHWKVGVQRSAAAQRTGFRTVQEGLTNVAKHAPGATVRLTFDVTRDTVSISLTNSAALQDPDPLPYSRSSLLDLHERAHYWAAHCGTVDAPTAVTRFRRCYPPTVRRVRVRDLARRGSPGVRQRAEVGIGPSAR